MKNTIRQPVEAGRRIHVLSPCFKNDDWLKKHQSCLETVELEPTFWKTKSLILALRQLTGKKGKWKSWGGCANKQNTKPRMSNLRLLQFLAQGSHTIWRAESKWHYLLLLGITSYLTTSMLNSMCCSLHNIFKVVHLWQTHVSEQQLAPTQTTPWRKYMMSKGTFTDEIKNHDAVFYAELALVDTNADSYHIPSMILQVGCVLDRVSSRRGSPSPSPRSGGWDGTSVLWQPLGSSHPFSFLQLFHGMKQEVLRLVSRHVI